MSSDESEEFESADEDYEFSPRIKEVSKGQESSTFKNANAIIKNTAADSEQPIDNSKVAPKLISTSKTITDEVSGGNDKSTNSEQPAEADFNESTEDNGDWGDFDESWDELPTIATKHSKEISEQLSKSVTISEPASRSTLKKSETDHNRAIDNQKGISQSVAKECKDNAWTWKPWGGVMSTILSSATEGVNTLASTVSQGLTSVIGAPDPEELAKIKKMEEDKTKTEKDDDAVLSSLDTIVSGVTNIGSKVITGGLDTLEGIGKKTMTILQENDPLLLNKRKMLGLESGKPILSQVLREAKEKSEEIERNLKQMHHHSYKKKLHFEILFDNHNGLIHLEALEMLSKQSSIKLQSLLEPLSGKALVELQETLHEVKELCELGDTENENDGLYKAEELKEKLIKAVEDLDIATDFQDIVKCWADNDEWLNKTEEREANDVYEKGLRCLAETCALAIQKYHKLAEMLLIKDNHSTANEADSLVQLTTLFSWHLYGVANRFGEKLNTFGNAEETSSLITSIFVEVYNGNSYIQNAFQLFIPILQLGAA